MSKKIKAPCVKQCGDTGTSLCTKANECDYYKEYQYKIQKDLYDKQQTKPEPSVAYY